MNAIPCYSGLTFDSPLCFNSTKYPIYHIPKPQLIDGIPDHILTLAAPVIGYWTLSLFFHFLDISEWKFLDKYRIHDSAEVSSKNLVTKSQVVWAVIFQQVVQTVLGLLVLSEDSAHLVDHQRNLCRIAVYVGPVLTKLLGNKLDARVLGQVSDFIYWWGIPSLQFFGAMCVLVHLHENLS